MTNTLNAKAAHTLQQLLEPTKPTQAAPRKKRSLIVRSVLWTPGQTLGISFLDDPDPDFKQHVYETARQWLDYANLQFELREDDDFSAQIRISSDGPPLLNHSIVGNSEGEYDYETMTLDPSPYYDWVIDEYPEDPEDPEDPLLPLDAQSREVARNLINRSVLHEFGHALGLHHEHLHPDANIPWNADALRAKLIEQRPQGDMDAALYANSIEEALQANYFRAPDADDRIVLRYDKKSIMHYAIDKADTLGGYEVAASYVLSQKDKQAIAMAYPGRVDPATLQPLVNDPVAESTADSSDAARQTLLEQDHDGDGKVSVEELRLAWSDTYSEAAFDEIIKQVDIDSDGLISVDEFFVRLDRSTLCN